MLHFHDLPWKVGTFFTIVPTISLSPTTFFVTSTTKFSFSKRSTLNQIRGSGVTFPFAPMLTQFTRPTRKVRSSVSIAWLLWNLVSLCFTVTTVGVIVSNQVGAYRTMSFLSFCLLSSYSPCCAESASKARKCQVLSTKL